MGYTSLDEEFHCFAGDYLDSLKIGLRLIEEQSMELKMTLMSEEDRKKQELLNQRKVEYAAKMAADKKRKEDL